MDKKYLITCIVISAIGILMTVCLIPVLTVVSFYYTTQELLGIDENTFAIVGILITIITLLTLFKKGGKYLSAYIFSFVYYLFIPTAYMQLKYYDTTDGQLAFAIFPIYIAFSIILFFVLMLLAKAKQLLKKK